MNKASGGDGIPAAAAAAAKSLQSCLTLCDPIEGSPPSSPIPGILQASTLEWGAFSNSWNSFSIPSPMQESEKWKWSRSGVQLLATPWTAAHQAPLSIGFSKQEFWSGVPLPSLGIPANLFQIRNDASAKVPHSIFQQIWKTQQWPQGWKRSVFIPIPKKGKPKEFSNYHTIACISHTSKVMLKILQGRFQKHMNQGFPNVQARFRKCRGTRDQVANIHWIIKKSRGVHWLCYSLWLCRSQQTMETS